jgi:hypothetical protein
MSGRSNRKSARKTKYRGETFSDESKQRGERYSDESKQIIVLMKHLAARLTEGAGSRANEKVDARKDSLAELETAMNERPSSSSTY